MHALPAFVTLARLTDVQHQPSRIVQHEIYTRCSRSVCWQPIERCGTQAEAKRVYCVWIAMHWCKVEGYEVQQRNLLYWLALPSALLVGSNLSFPLH